MELILPHSFELIRMDYNVVLKQFRLGILISIQSENDDRHH